MSNPPSVQIVRYPRPPRSMLPYYADYDSRKQHVGLRYSRGAVTACYKAVLLRTPTGYSSYFPALPGCVAAASSLQKARSLTKEALAWHVVGYLEDGDPLPEPTSTGFEQEDGEEKEEVVECVLVYVRVAGKFRG